jgi:superfamily II DNA or RNA helicase
MTQGIYKKFTCSAKTSKNRKPFIPTPHQKLVLDYFPNSPYKGLLLYHKLGSGKTCTSVMIADKMLKDRQIDRVFVCSPGSLRKNWIEEYCKVCGVDPEFLNYYYTFITYNANIYSGLPSIDFNNSLIIIDEAHNLMNAVKNCSKNGFALYKKIMNSKCRVLALSGTPVFNETYEWSLMGNMLNPGSVTNIITGGRVDRFLWDDTKISDKSLQGIVSYFPGDPSMYPKVYYHDPIEIKMTDIQWHMYLQKSKVEEFTRRMGPPDEKLKSRDPYLYKSECAMYMVANKYTMSRRWSNFYYTQEIINKPDKLVKNGGWVDDDALSDKKLLELYSPKFTTLIVNIIVNLNTKHMVYTFFKERAGVELLKTLLNKANIKCEIFSGDLSDTQRSKILKNFNSVDNRDGQKIKVLLVTDAGAEGITVLETNNMHIMESSTREKRTIQAIGRVVRYKSHINMPSDRQYVNIWRYWSVGPENEPAVDEELYVIGLESIEKSDAFLSRLEKNSIEKILLS